MSNTKEADWAEISLDEEEKAVEKTSEKQEVKKEDKPAPQVDEADQETEETTKSDSLRVQKRIRKLTRLRKEAEEREAAAAQRLQELERQNNELSQRLTSAVNNGVDAVHSQLQDNLKLAKKALMDAFEKGDASALADAQEAVSIAAARITQAKSAQANRPAVRKEEEQEDKGTQKQTQQKQYPREAVKWANSKDWWGENKRATNMAVAIDQELTEEGYDPEDPDYYKELDSRLSEVFPKLYEGDESVEDVEDDEEDAPKAAPRKKTKSPVAGASRSSASNKNVVRLERQELEHTRTFDLDPKTWAKRKREVENANGGYVEIDI